MAKILKKKFLKTLTGINVHRHDGEIAASSRKNEGSSFTFTIPFKNQVIHS